MLKPWGSTETAVTSSSGVAEYRGMVEGGCVGAWLHAVRRDFGAEAGIVFRIAGAAVALPSWRGLGPA